MGEPIVVDQKDIKTLEDEVQRAASNYVKSYNDLENVMQNASQKSIRGPLADDLKAKFDAKKNIFDAIRTELIEAEKYLGEKGQKLVNTINSVIENMR